ncbi:MAG TPA: FecR domain-containing protein [Spirochaetota bacterium]|nr:FecR domain-containing protein [Spirochaetota bacterium]
MKRDFLTAAVLVAVLLLSGCSREKAPETAMITFIMGDVVKNSAEAVIGELVKENDVITTAADSFCDIKLGESFIRIKAKSKVTISSMLINSGRESIILLLEDGMLLCKPKKMINPDYFFIKTPTAVAAVRGTQFSVETDSLLTTRVKVFKGEVKVIIRVKQFDADYGRFLEYAPSLKEEEKVVITASEFRDTNKIVERVLKEETGRGNASGGNVIERVIKRTKNDVVVKKEKIKKFRPEDFVSENREIIEVEEKPGDVVKKIAMFVKQDRENPVPEGRLLITRSNVYFIKEGKVKWQSRLRGDPAGRGDRLFIAAGEYVFCAMSDGPVVWKKPVANDGSIDLKDGKVIVRSNGKPVTLDESTGD